MASMSYCVFENTTSELQAVMHKLLKGEVSDWSDTEIRAVKKIFNYADSIMECREEIEARLEEEELARLEEEEEDFGIDEGDIQAHLERGKI